MRRLNDADPFDGYGRKTVEDEAIIASIRRANIPRGVHRGDGSGDGLLRTRKGGIFGSTQSVENPVETLLPVQYKTNGMNGLVLFALDDSSVTWGMRFAW
jgi:hypothetical protein